jgi:hypothetical protein
MQRNSDTAKEQTKLRFLRKCAFACSYEYVWCYYARVFRLSFAVHSYFQEKGLCM